MTASSDTGKGFGSAENIIKVNNITNPFVLAGVDEVDDVVPFAKVKRAFAAGFVNVKDNDGGSAPVTSVFTRTGDIVAESGDYDAMQIAYDNTSTGVLADDVQDAIDDYVISPPEVKSLVVFGADSVNTTTTDRYLFPGYSDDSALTTETYIEMTTSGMLRDLYVIHNNPSGNGNNITYTVRKNNSDTSLTVTLPSTDISASDELNTVEFNVGDNISIRVSKPSTIGATPQHIYATMRLL